MTASSRRRRRLGRELPLRKLQRALQGAQADLAYRGWQNVGAEGEPGKEAYVPSQYEAEDAVALVLKGWYP